MTETEAIIRIASALESIRILFVFINMALWLILLCKRCYSDTNEIKNAIEELTNHLRSRR